MDVKSCVKVAMLPQIRALAAFVLALGSVTYVSGAEAVKADEMEERCLPKRVFTSAPEIQLGNCVEFENEIYAVPCREVVAGSHSIGWFASLTDLGGRLVGYRCQADDKVLYPGDARRRWGGADAFLSEVKAPIGQGLGWTVAEMHLPGLGYFSRPSFCGTAIAYWHNPGPGNDVAYDVAVFDVRQDALVARHEAVNAILSATDNPAAFPNPAWSDDCRTVRFFFDKMTSPIIVELTPRN